MNKQIKILIVNGPNLHLLGKREPEIYGDKTLSDVEVQLKNTASELGKNIMLEFFQSNSEGDIIDKITDYYNNKYNGIIINPAGYTHTSVALHDALKAVPVPAIEVHISNISARDEFRKNSITAGACIGQICGLGLDGYELALRALVKKS